ncbi:MAG: ATP-binding protein [Planctomycetes bacterium]|nr:ATP-binding protein [Planctomycetota bacterium]NUQ35629.1 ATP-binding protein [Planctomycetaceae bacterium]
MARELLREIELPVEPRSLLPMRDFLKRAMDEAEIDPTDQRAVVAAIDETLTTSLVGGKREGRRGNIRVTIDINPTRLRLLLHDESEGAELKENPEEGIIQHATHARRELGLSLLRRVMDEVRYVYRRGFQNELEMIKFLPVAETPAAVG